MSKKELEKIDKEIRRSIFIVRYKKLIFRLTIIIGIVLLALVVGLIWYDAITPEPECTIDSQCESGEICRDKKCVPSPESLPPEDFTMEVIETAMVKATDDTYDLIAKVKNPDTEWGIKELKYAFVFKDQGGRSMQEERFEGTTYILPREEIYIVYLGAEIGEYSDFSLILEPVTWKKLSRFPEPELQVKNVENRVSNDGISKYKVSGTVINNSDYDFERVDIVVILRNSKGKIIGVNKTNLNAFYRQTERDVLLQWYHPVNGTVDDVEFVAEADVFSSVNFINRYGMEREVYQEFVVEEDLTDEVESD